MTSHLFLDFRTDRRPEQLAETVRALRAELARRPEYNVSDVPEIAKPGERSAITGGLFQLAITFLSGGAASALIAALSKYFEADPTLTVRVKTVGGSEVEISGALEPTKALQLIQALRADG